MICISKILVSKLTVNLSNGNRELCLELASYTWHG